MMTINERAPVAAAGEIEVAADPEVVWDVMAAIDRWPSWNPDVTRASLDGELAEGTRFRWKAGPGTITSTLRRVERPRLLAWTGKTLGVDAIQVWRLEARGANTFVRTEESWEGLMARILRGPMQKMLQDAIDAGLRHLKAEAERRSAV
jgi:uncharacterized protein YndB with AHSA1/START domain